MECCRAAAYREKESLSEQAALLRSLDFVVVSCWSSGGAKREMLLRNCLVADIDEDTRYILLLGGNGTSTIYVNIYLKECPYTSFFLSHTG